MSLPVLIGDHRASMTDSMNDKARRSCHKWQTGSHIESLPREETLPHVSYERRQLVKYEVKPMSPSDELLVTRDQLLVYIKELIGLTISTSTMNQLCAPSRGEGPPVRGYVGRRPYYHLGEGLEWARQRLRPSPYALHKEKQQTMAAHDRKPLPKREKDWGDDYWAAKKRI